jgi:Na+/H+ antiporter NhaC
VTRKDGKASPVFNNLRHIFPHIFYFLLSGALTAVWAARLLVAGKGAEGATAVFALAMVALNLYCLYPPIGFFFYKPQPVTFAEYKARVLRC